MNHRCWHLLSVNLLAAGCVLFMSGCGRKAAAPEAGAASAPALVPVRMHLDWLPQTEYGGYYQARERGFYREAGLDVEIISGGPGVPFKETVALERAELGCTDGNDVIVAISRGVPLVIVAAEMQRNPQGILYHDEHPLADFKSLQGRLFMAGPQSAWVEYLKRHFALTFDQVPLTADLTSFLADKTMVRQCFVTQEPFFARQHGARVGTLLIADSGYAPYRVIYTSRAYLAKKPEIVRAFVAASVRGFDDMLDGDPQPAFAALHAANALMTPDVMAFSREAMKTLRLVQGDSDRGESTGRITRARLAEQIETLQSLGQLGKSLTVDDVAVFEFAP